MSDEQIQAAADALSELNQEYAYKQRELWVERNRYHHARNVENAATRRMEDRCDVLNHEADALQNRIRGAEQVLKALGILDRVMEKVRKPE